MPGRQAQAPSWSPFLQVLRGPLRGAVSWGWYASATGPCRAKCRCNLTCRSTGGATAGHLAREAPVAYPAPRGQGALPRRPGYLYVRPQIPMRYQGRLVEWNEAKGFGFIAPNGGGGKVFVHISDLPRGSTRPSLGTLLTYELASDPKGRPTAVAARPAAARAPQHYSGWRQAAGTLFAAAVLAAAGYVIWVRLNSPGSTVKATVYKLLFAREALRDSKTFTCKPERTSCSAMTSCAEALLHQERCGVANMDGDHDGIPCEQQLCN
jgi:cold shock CspA family protein